MVSCLIGWVLISQNPVRSCWMNQKSDDWRIKMSAFIRIKDYFINLDALAYIKIEEDSIAFRFCEFGAHAEKQEGQNYILFEKGIHLKDVEFKQLKEFVSDLPSLDRVVII